MPKIYKFYYVINKLKPNQGGEQKLLSIILKAIIKTLCLVGELWDIKVDNNINFNNNTNRLMRSHYGGSFILGQR